MRDSCSRARGLSRVISKGGIYIILFVNLMGIGKHLQSAKDVSICIEDHM